MTTMPDPNDTTTADLIDALHQQAATFDDPKHPAALPMLYAAQRLRSLASKRDDAVRRYNLALQSLTPGGSEYVDDPERCVAYVRDRYATMHRQIIDRVKELKELRAEAERLNRRHVTNVYARDAAVAEASTANELREVAELRLADLQHAVRVPDGAKAADAWWHDGYLVVCGTPAPDDESHNCDAMGCGSVSHVVSRIRMGEDGRVANPPEIPDGAEGRPA